jgi:nitrogen fixation protein FixH
MIRESSTMQSIDSSSTSASGAPGSSLPGRLWPWVPAFLLTALLGTQLLVLSSVLDDPSFATEPDYYRKAVSWDARMELSRQSQALGWQAAARVENAAAGQTRLEVALVDAQGRDIVGAKVSAVVFANTRAAQPLELGLGELEPGRYQGELGWARPGVWEARVSAARGTDRYETSLRFEVFEPQVER